MARGNFDMKHHKIKLQRAIIVALLLVALAVGGVTAFLSTSDGALTNNLALEDEPIVAVNPGGTIMVHYRGYWVYLRANVVVNWVNTSNNAILAEPPAATDYTLKVNGEKWLAHTDGFYYYREVIKDNENNIPCPVTITPEVEKPGYTLKLTVLAQTVQAVGQTDTAPYKDAVEDAWGITAETITGTSGT